MRSFDGTQPTTHRESVGGEILPHQLVRFSWIFVLPIVVGVDFMNHNYLRRFNK